MLEEMVPDAVERRWIEPRLTGLLGLDDLPVESREAVAAWRTFFERLAEQSTTILIFWDLQWADQGLLDFIEHLLIWARTSPLFVLAEARPELPERRPGWGASVRNSATIHLEPLSSEDMRLLLGGLVVLPEQAHAGHRRPSRRRAALRRRDPPDAHRPRRPAAIRGWRPIHAGRRPARLDLPATLQALIAARLDTLAAEDRSLLMDASVLGLSFTVPSLRALTEMDDADYPWPNGFNATFVSNSSTASKMALQNPVTNTPVSWTYLQFNFAQALTNAGGTIPLVVDPNRPYTPYCTEDYLPPCTPPRPDISQEQLRLAR